VEEGGGGSGDGDRSGKATTGGHRGRDGAGGEDGDSSASGKMTAVVRLGRWRLGFARADLGP
jgi:hypothetical protein